MTEEDFFLLDILARPDDDAPRLIYADWLEDHDDPRAAFVRLGWDLRGTRPSASRVTFVRERAAAALERGWIVHDDLVLSSDQFLLVCRLRLAETIACCAGREPPLRTPDLDPRALMGYFDASDWPASGSIDWPAMVLQLAIARRRLLDWKGRLPGGPASGLSGGRLLFFDVRASRYDGAARRSSNGYFDAENLPPWDTWVVQVSEPSPISHASDYLVAWVPPSCIPRVSGAIEVNEEGCIAWLGSIRTPFVRRLRQAGLVT